MSADGREPVRAGGAVPLRAGRAVPLRAGGAVPVVSVVVAPGAPGALGALGDVDATRRVLDLAAAERGVRGRLVLTSTAAELSAAVADAAAAGEPVVVPGDVRSVDDLRLPGTAPVVRVDLADRPADPSPRVRRHVRGRGLDAIRYAVDAWYFHRTSPATVHRYGLHPDQRAELRLPGTGASPAGGFPVAVLVHGGYWRSRWENDLMEAMAVDLGARGVATWNVEYRRPDAHGWASTTADVAAALRALPDADAPLDLTRVAVLGHSAGGQLVTRLAADIAADPSPAVRPVLAVALAGVLDLVEGDRRRLGDGAVSTALGGSATEVPETYRASSPMARVPVGLPLAVVCGTGDDPHLLAMARAFAAAARAAGDDVAVVEGRGDHFAVIDPSSALWPAIVDVVMCRLGR